MNEETNALEGTRLYKPGVLAAYIVLSGLPIGLLLYGLNLARRGQRWLGGALWALSAILLALMLALVAADGRVSGLGILSIPIAIWVYATERKHYALALQKGARPAKWWPPLLLLLGLILVMGLTVASFGPEDNVAVP
jgi:hypothetical protein